MIVITKSWFMFKCVIITVMIMIMIMIMIMSRTSGATVHQLAISSMMEEASSRSRLPRPKRGPERPFRCLDETNFFLLGIIWKVSRSVWIAKLDHAMHLFCAKKLLSCMTSPVFLQMPRIYESLFTNCAAKATIFCMRSHDMLLHFPKRLWGIILAPFTWCWAFQ